MEMQMMGQPKVAVVGSNTLALIGLRQLLQSVMPMIGVDTLGSFAELTWHSEIKRKESFPFVFLSFYRNFAA